MEKSQGGKAEAAKRPVGMRTENRPAESGILCLAIRERTRAMSTQTPWEGRAMARRPRQENVDHSSENLAISF